MNKKIIIIALISFILGYFISYKNLKPTQEYLNENTDKFYRDVYSLNDIHVSYFIARALNEIRKNKVALKEIIYLEAILWQKLDLIESTYGKSTSEWKKENQKVINYIRDYKSTYLKIDPHKLIPKKQTKSTQ